MGDRVTWLRSSLRRLRDAPAAALGFALLVFVTALIFAAAPRVVDALADRAVRDELRAAEPAAANLQLTELTRLRPGAGAPLDEVRAQGDELFAQYPTLVRDIIASHGPVVDTPRWQVTSPLPEPGTLAFRFQDGAAERIAYAAGRPPTGATRQVPGEGPGPNPEPVTVFEGAISAETAATLQLHLGDVVRLSLDGSDTLVGAARDGSQLCAVEIVGIFRPLDPSDPLWYAENGLLRATTRVYGPSLAINDGRVLLAEAAYGPLITLTDGAGVVLRYQWRYFLDPERVRSRDLAALEGALQRTESIFSKSPAVARASAAAQLTTALGDLLADFGTRWSFATAVMATGAAGPAAMAIAALDFVALLAARRRRPILAAWRSRGASTAQVLRGTFGEGLLVGGPAAVLATGLAIALVGDAPPGASIVAGCAVLLAGAALVGLLEVPPALSPKSGGATRDDAPIAAPPSRRRVVAEILLVVLAAAATVLLRQRGTGTAGVGAAATANPLLAAAPALDGIAVALFARRLFPLPIRALAWLAARRSDLPAVLAMRRAARQGGGGAATVVLLASVAISVFGAATVLSLNRGADLVAWQTVGADYRLSSLFGTLPDGLDSSPLPGVTARAAAYRGKANVATDLGAYDLLAIDAGAYAALVRGTPADPELPPEMLEPRPATLPVILSTVVAARTGVHAVGQDFVLWIKSLPIPAHVAAIRDAFPSLPIGGTFVVISRDQAASGPAALALKSTDLFLAAPDDARAGLLGTLAAARPERAARQPGRGGGHPARPTGQPGRHLRRPGGRRGRRGLRRARARRGPGPGRIRALDRGGPPAHARPLPRPVDSPDRARARARDGPRPGGRGGPGPGPLRRARGRPRAGGPARVDPGDPALDRGRPVRPDRGRVARAHRALDRPRGAAPGPGCRGRGDPQGDRVSGPDHVRPGAGAHRVGPIITCENLVRIFKLADLEVVALQGLDLVIREGEIVAIVGASGSGKSTLMGILGGMDVPSAGRALVAGHDLTQMGRAERTRYRRRVVGFIGQQTERNLLPYLSAVENVEVPMILDGRGGTRVRALELLELVGLDDRAAHRPDRLSGGEQQRVAIAVALANDPAVLLADEPTGELDSATAAEVFGVLRTANREMGTTILVVTHDPLVSEHVERTVAIRDGRTSTETFRRRVFADDGSHEMVAEEFAVLDRAGRVQLPRAHVEKLGLRDRVQLRLEQDHVGIWQDPSQQGPDGAGPAGSDDGERGR